MRAGILDRRVVLQRKAQSLSSSGTPTETWSTVATRWAGIRPLTGDERNAAQQWVAREQTRFTVRWSDDVADLSPLDRVIYPSADASNSPVPTRSIYDIIAVHELGRFEGLMITAARRVA